MLERLFMDRTISFSNPGIFHLDFLHPLKDHEIPTTTHQDKTFYWKIAIPQAAI